MRDTSVWEENNVFMFTLPWQSNVELQHSFVPIWIQRTRISFQGPLVQLLSWLRRKAWKYVDCICCASGTKGQLVRILQYHESSMAIFFLPSIFAPMPGCNLQSTYIFHSSVTNGFKHKASKWLCSHALPKGHLKVHSSQVIVMRWAQQSYPPKPAQIPCTSYEELRPEHVHQAVTEPCQNRVSLHLPGTEVWGVFSEGILGQGGGGWLGGWQVGQWPRHRWRSGPRIQHLGQICSWAALLYMDCLNLHHQFRC